MIIVGVITFVIGTWIGFLGAALMTAAKDDYEEKRRGE